MASLTAELLGEIRERAKTEALAISKDLIAVMDGVDDETLSRADRIARFLDDAQSGALDVMKVIRPDLYDKAIADYQRDVAQSPLMGA